jgi:condensin-2 complex subunit H2
VTPRELDSALWALCDAGNGAEAAEGQAQFKARTISILLRVNQTLTCCVARAQIASCAVHFTGALLLDPRDAALLDEHLQYRVEAPLEAAAPAAEAGAAEEADLGAGGMGGGWADDDDGRMDDVPGDAAFPADDAAAPVAYGLQDDEEEEEEEADPWAPLDYNDAAGLPVKPFRKGRTQRREAAVAGSVAAAEARATCAARQATRLGALFPEFAYAYEERAKTRKRERAAATRAAVARGAAPAAVAALAAAEEEDDDFGGGGDFGGDFGGGFSDDDALPPLDTEALAAAAAEGAAPPSWGDAAPPPLAPRDDMSYEDLVRAHVDRYLALAAASEGQTDLAVRVASWKSKIEPALQEQEARPAFDIHACGASVLSALQDAAPAPATPDMPAPAVRFEALMAEREVFEVARSFAAMLQLVNAGNLDIVAMEGDEGASLPFAIQLLSTAAQGTLGALDAYRAPSLDDAAAPAKPVAKAAGKAVKGAPAAKRRAALAGGSQ